MSLLSVSDLHVYYGGIHALKGISFDVEEGEIVTLIGANGAGKTTTLRAISGLVKAQKGQITFRGKRISNLAPHLIVASGLAHAPEGRGIFPNLTVAENLDIGAFLRRDSAAVAKDKEHALTLFPRVKERLAQNAGTLSGGEQQMLAIGRALMSKPRLLLLDEPSLGLAPIVIQQIFDTIEQLRQKGMTIFLVEQNANQALKLADRGYVLENGRVVLQDTGEALLANPAVRQAYLGG